MAGADPRVIATAAVIIGIVLAGAILWLTGYFTGTEDKPVKDVGRSSLTGAATVILSGISVGFESAVYTALVISAAVFGAFPLATGSITVALFAVALAGTGLLTTVGVIVAMDTFGPVADNAQGIAEMSGDVEGAGRGHPHRAGRGRATPPRPSPRASRSPPRCSPPPRCSAPTATPSTARWPRPAWPSATPAPRSPARCSAPNTLVGVIIGASVVFMFSGLAINAVTRAAGAIVFEVRRQFRENPGIMEGTVRPEYGRVVDICTRDSLRELATPGLLAIFAPIAVGFGLGVGPLAGYLAGAIACRHPDGGLPGQLRWRVGQREEAGRGRQPRRQGLARARGHRHRRHRRRPVQGHRRPVDQPADQGDEPGLGADRAGRGRPSRWASRPRRRCGSTIALVAAAIIVAAVVVSKRRSTTIADTPAESSVS